MLTTSRVTLSRPKPPSCAGVANRPEHDPEAATLSVSTFCPLTTYAFDGSVIVTDAIVAGIVQSPPPVTLKYPASAPFRYAARVAAPFSSVGANVSTTDAIE